MKFTPNGDSLIVDCPAKVNLFLEIHGIRPDGYHEIETVMQAVTLYDRLTLRPRGQSGISLDCSDPTLPQGAENLAYRAADLLDGTVGLPSGVSIRLDKQIPAGAGLGGGSSDAAGVLAGLNRLFGLGLSVEDLCRPASELGSDIPFFLYGATALCRGRGERVSPVPAAAPIHYVICCPEQPVPTAEAYRTLDSAGLTNEKRSASFMLDSLQSGDIERVRNHVFNRFGEVAERLAPDVGRTKNMLAAHGARGAWVSGSGSAVFAVFPAAEDAATVARRVRQCGCRQVFVARSEKTTTET